MGAFDDLIPTSSQPAMSNAPRVGYIPGTPKAKDPLDVESKSLGIDKARRDALEWSATHNADGSTKPDATGKPATGEQGMAAGFYQRSLYANKRYGDGVEPRDALTQGVVNMLPTGVVNSMMGSERQKAEAFQRDFVAATLRKESGAAISPEEYQNQALRYFPAPGDGPETIQAKKRLRDTAIASLRNQAGPAAITADQAVQDMLAQDQADQNQHGTTTVLSQDGSKSHYAPDLSHQLDGMMRDPHTTLDSLNAFIKQSAPNNQPVSADQFNVVRQYLAAHPGYKGMVANAIVGDPTNAANSAVNAAAQSGGGAYGIAAADTLTGGHLDNMVGASGGNADLANMGIQNVRANNPKMSFAGDLTGGMMLGAAGAGMGVAGEAGAFAPRAIGADMALGGYVGSGQNGTQLIDPGSTIKGAGVGALAGMGGRGLTNGAAGLISPTGGDLAPLYAAGVKPTLGQRAGGIVNRAEQAFTSIPALGGIQRAARGAAIDEMQTGAFNQALNEIDSALPKGIKKGTQANAFVQDAFNRVYDKARAGMQFGIDDQFTSDVSQITHAADLLNGDSRGIVKKIADDVGNKLAASGGTLSGKQFQLVQSRIANKIAALRSSKTGDDELAGVLGDLQTAIDNAARRQSPKAASDLLDKADKGYAKLVIIENAARARGGEPGEFSGVGLDRAVQTTNSSRRSRAYLRGEANMQDYATAARRLGDNVADSGSAERLLTNGGMALTAHSVSPLFAIPWAVDTAATLPGVRQVLGSLMAPSASAAKKAAANKVRLGAGTIGGLLSGSASAETTRRR